MDIELKNILMYIAIIAFSITTIYQIRLRLKQIRLRLKQENNKSNVTLSPSGVQAEPIVQPSQELLHSYRCAIASSTTVMALFEYLANHYDAQDSELMDYVYHTVIKKPLPDKLSDKTHFMHVLFALFGAHFVNKIGDFNNLTSLGRRAYANILNRDAYPPVTGDEILGYKELLKKYTTLTTILACLRVNHSIEGNILLEKVKEKYQNIHHDYPADDAVNNLLTNIGSRGWISKNIGNYSITNLGKQVCEDLQIR